jgi:hypothetical protein
MSKLEEIQLQKAKIEHKKEELLDLKREIRSTEEEYEEYFFYQKQLFSDLQEEFAQSQTDMLYQDMAEEIKWQSQGIQEFLEDQHQEFSKQIRNLEDKQDELYWQKIQSKGETEDKNEY